MKSTILKSIKLATIAASVLTSCFALSNAYADDANLSLNGRFATPFSDFPGKLYNSFDTSKLNRQYGDIVEKKYLENNAYYTVSLHGAFDQPKRGAFTIEEITENGQPKKLIFNSKEKASQLCKDLIPPESTSNSVFAFYTYPWVIMVPYAIAYDTGSQEANDGTGTSVPATKYVMCPNYGGTKEWKLDPSNNNENEVTGILSSKLNEAKTEYTVTCMPASGKKTAIFKRVDVPGTSSWVNVEAHQAIIVNPQNLTGLHQFNKLVGAQYCPVTPE